jgi:hypothetical protein
VREAIAQAWSSSNAILGERRMGLGLRPVKSQVREIGVGEK